jgi:hypothetical protein
MIYSSTASSPAIGDTGMVPRGFPLNGGQPVQHLNGSAHEPPGAGRPSATSPPPAGHNKPNFDAIAQENLRRGLYRSQRDAMSAVAHDPRCTKRHVLVHAIVIGFMNSETGMSFPGWRAIAEKAAMFPGGVPDPAGVYDESTIYNLLSDLRRWGYLPSVKRGPEGGGRAIAHYTIAEPPYDKLREEITKFIMKGRARGREERERLDALAARQPDLTAPREVSGASDLTRVRDDSSDLTRGRAADLTRGRVTVTCIKKEPVEEALDAYNEAADMHSFAPCRTLTDARRKRLDKRLKDIGGVDAFKRALSALPRNDFLMGRVRPKPGKKPFKLELDTLLQTDGNLGDVLARLLDAAEDTPTGNGTFEEEVRALRDRHPEVPVEDLQRAVAESRRSRGLD